jgi:hypothetical protein
MYKVSISVLENIKKQLLESNRVLMTLKQSTDTVKTIKGNCEQIKLITEQYYID